MNKLFKRLCTLAAGIAMAIGVGVAIGSGEKGSVRAEAGEEVAYTLTATDTGQDGDSTNYASGKDTEISSKTWNVTGNSHMVPWRLGVGKKVAITNGDRAIFSKTAISENITKVTITSGTRSGITVNKLKLSVYDSADDAESGSNSIADFEESSSNKIVGNTVTFTKANNTSWANKYYRIAYNLTGTNTNSAKYIEFSEAKFYYNTSTPATGISLASTNFTPFNNVITIEKDSDDDTDTLVATVTPNTATDKTVTWSSNNENVAIVIDGVVAIETSAVGEATITATANGGTNVTATMTYSVVDSSAYTVSVTATNGSYLPASPKISPSGSVTITFSPNNGYKLPTSSSAFTVTNATLTSWNSTNGQLVISDPSAAPSVSVSMTPLSSYVITVSNTYCTYTGVTSGTTTIREDQTATITFTANLGYELPTSVSLTNASVQSWTKATGVLVIHNPTGPVTVSVTATKLNYTNTTNLTPGIYFIKYVDGNTNHYLTGISSKSTGSTSTSKQDALAFTFNLVGNDTWEITNGSNYLGIGSTSTSLSLGSTSKTCTIAWDDEISGTRTIGSGSGRYLSWYETDSDIRTYTTGTLGMTLESAKTVSSFSIYSDEADKNVLKGTNFDADAAAAAGFQARLNYTDSTFDDVTASSTWTLDTSSTGTKTLTVEYLSYSDTVDDMNVYVVIIKTLSIDTTDADTSYVEGDQLSTAGLVITGYELDSTPHSIPISSCAFSPANGAILSLSDTTITVTYTNDDTTTATNTYTIAISEFVGYKKVTGLSGLVVGESYVLGVENINHSGDLMGSATAQTASAVRSRVDASDAFNVSYTNVSPTEASSAGAVVITLLSDGNGKYAFYDITNNKYLSGSSSNYLVDNSTLSAAGDNAWWTISFADNLMSVTLNNTTRVLAYNAGSPRFSTYAGYGEKSTTATNVIAHPILFKMEGSAVKTAVTSFANTSLKMNDPAYEGDISTPNCASNYAAMKTAYAALTDAQKNVFQYSSDYAAARARMEKWAIANGESFTYGAATPFASTRINLIANAIENNSIAITVSIISIVSGFAVGGYFFLRKRKED